MSGSEQILEHLTTGQIPADRIDRERGIIRGVKVLGERSANPPPRNNDYPLATRQKARGILEGGRVGVNHPEASKAGQTRPYEQLMGVIKNVRETADGSYGDWHFPPKHPLAESVCWDAEHNPNGLGFSINATAGRITVKDGRRIVEEIASLESIDLVSRPATTAGIFEGLAVKQKIKPLLEGQYKLPHQAEALREMAESGVLSDSAEMAAPEGDAGIEAMLSMLREAATAKDWEKCRKIVKGFEKMLADKAPEKKAEEGREVTPADLLEIKALRLINQKSIKLTPVIERAIKGCRTEAEVTELVESLTAAPAPAARSAGPWNPPAAPKKGADGKVTEEKIPDDPKAMGRFLRE